MRYLTPTLAICTLAAAFTAGALTAGPLARPSTGATPPAGGPAEQAGEQPVLTITSFAFSAISVAPGATIRIVNQDSVPHTVTADSGAFDVFVEAGGEATLTAPATPGTYPFYCTVHPSMTGALTVT